MIPALWISKTGLDAQNLKLQVVSNNLANVSTTGFKKDRAVFQSLFYQNVRQAGAENAEGVRLPSGLMLGRGVAVGATLKQHDPGTVQITNRTLDIRINGRGFFQITMPDGTTQYTRSGQFTRNENGTLVTAEGNPLVPQIDVPQDALTVSIGVDGQVSATTPGTVTPTVLGTIQLATFVNNAGLEPQGNNLFKETVASGAATLGNPAADAYGSTRQGELEASNVNVVEELIGLIETQRAYEMNSKSISTADGMMQFLNQTI
ncbi:flagellar basal-body rod protein FlgG [Piscirickettsia salmonis]|uniref:Flagellar basal-body rod protein FlgG n=1 Tax=Piscirickettsia salmonis TaxID=1238 RepID=A0A9Q5VFR7_PISSA|nr:flagellar basal-body rod protein FlgG [Piscirickettsia salmonis]RNC78234.1 flagellar basal-body rod protein FlgG [Piscirickettsiaceae bacterium NZ-RLO2]ALA25459.1 flagellar basal-body rod protein FlgG [Piscirickettsia salmonis]APS42975.1 flagellar basal-body rod protein FlgG [Piscirickettsia salmonis]APS46323.1 flagellar basal-body rod protein FlgG [Piscirickettsia salmonis]APS50274.1 flagellar basal-body rod protein FlgG [Piscirickettsia salmonis]